MRFKLRAVGKGRGFRLVWEDLRDVYACACVYVHVHVCVFKYHYWFVFSASAAQRHRGQDDGSID